jgi:hypothetical protein
MVREMCASAWSKPPAAAEARACSSITCSVEPTSACLAIGVAAAQPLSVSSGRGSAR